MSQNITLKITLEKLGFKKVTNSKGQTYMVAPVDLFYQGQSATYMDITGFINDDRNQYGNDGSLALPKKKGEDTPTIYCGSIKSWSKAPSAKPTDEAVVNNEVKGEDFDDLPF